MRLWASSPTANHGRALENVRGKDCFVLHHLRAANDSLMEVLLMWMR